MALHWQWKDKIGEMTLQQGKREWTINLYEGNAYLIMIHEFEEDGTEKYNVIGFFLDKQHMRNCLGLNKKNGYGDNIYGEAGNRATKFRINKKAYRHTKELVTALVEAFDEITIELYAEEEESK